MQQYSKDAVRAHALGRHASRHPEDVAFWTKTCEVCAVSSKLKPWMVGMVAEWAACLTDEQLAGWAGLPIDGATLGDMLNMIVAQKEIERRG